MTDDTKRMAPQQRRALIIEAAYDLVINTDFGLHGLTFDDVSDNCAVPTSVATVRRYFHTMADLQRAVVVRDRSLQDQAIRLGLM